MKNMLILALIGGLFLLGMLGVLIKLLFPWGLLTLASVVAVWGAIRYIRKQW